MSRESLLLVTGILLMLVGASLVIMSPPHVVTEYKHLTIPYTRFHLVTPGPYSFTKYYPCGRGFKRVKFPNYVSFRVGINCGLISNGTCWEDLLTITLEGKFRVSNNGYINLTVNALVNGRESLIDTIKVPIEPSKLLVMSTSSTIGTTPTTTPITPKTLIYVVGGSKSLLEAVVTRPSKDFIRVVITPLNEVRIPLNTSEVIVKVVSNVSGEAYISVSAKRVCEVTTYLRTPKYVPYVSYYSTTITYKYLDVGALTIATPLIATGTALALIAHYLRINLIAKELRRRNE